MSRVTWELLERVLARQCDPLEAARIERWIDASPSHALRVELLVAAVELSHTDKAHAWARLVGRAAARLPPSWGKARSRRRALTVAVLVVVVIGVAITIAIALSSIGQVSESPSARVVSTPAGQRAGFELPDGTRVILSVASTLRHPQVFGPEAREIELEGEAYFEVAPDARRPFVVRARNVVAEDLGTEFLVRAYPEDSGPSVVVRDGRVALRLATAPPNASKLVILAGQLGRFSQDGRPTIQVADTSAYFAWTQGWLLFDAVPLRDAIPQLSRWYGLDFRVADSSAGGVPLTATFRNQPTDEVLQLLAASLGLRQVRKGNQVTFHRVTAPR